MDQKELWRELKALPPQAQREVMDFIVFLRLRCQPLGSADKLKKTRFMAEPFLGM
jgi:hypothetical protein